MNKYFRASIGVSIPTRPSNFHVCWRHTPFLSPQHACGVTRSLGTKKGNLGREDRLPPSMLHAAFLCTKGHWEKEVLLIERERKNVWLRLWFVTSYSVFDGVVCLSPISLFCFLSPSPSPSFFLPLGRDCSSWRTYSIGFMWFWFPQQCTYAVQSLSLFIKAIYVIRIPTKYNTRKGQCTNSRRIFFREQY